MLPLYWHPRRKTIIYILFHFTHLHEIQYDPNTLPPSPKRNIWRVWHIVVSPLVVVAPCQHVTHDPPKNFYRLVYHKKVLTQIFEGRD
jgi:hypothetical protein